MDFLKSSILKEWLDKKYLKLINIEKSQKKYTQAPFSHIEFKDFFKKAKINEVYSALIQEEFYDKESDLFKFMQTSDLMQTDNQILKEFSGVLSSKPFTQFIEFITQNQLKAHKIDLFGSLYQNTDFLICHDDRLEGRKVAFILYFSDFKKKEGGALSLYSSKNNKPITAVKKIAPKKNSFVFFTVCKESFHSIDEVTVDKQRIALSGWFHEY
jgi:prolyl 3-hydroxylase /prolyl 3,4-dihydroxylase